MNNPVEDVELTAMVPSEMVESQKALVVWCDKKVESLKDEENDLALALDHASSQEWKTSALKNQFRLTKKRKEYFEKIKAALLAGYYIIPNFPITIFGIRTERGKPMKMVTTRNWGETHEQGAMELPTGKGEYKNPFPIIHQREIMNGEKKETEYFAKEWDDFEFPITMAKVEIMEATTAAMELGIFDQIGIMPAKKKEDPVIIGQIIHKRGPYTEKITSFMIAWHLNTNVL
jgi:hypothetical protein